MCGICGIVRFDERKVDEDLLWTMTNTMERRGPDAKGLIRFRNVGFGHRRLKVIDPSNEANQPMTSEDNRFTLVYNGEIYNFRELRKLLQSYGHTFTTNSDSEVVLRGFIQWQEALFSRLNGMFAIAIYDEKEEKLVLARDRHGIKPLFYHQSPKRLAFASELKPLIRLSSVQKTVDPQTLFYYLKFSHVPQPLSMICGINQIPPGSYSIWQGSSEANTIFWKPRITNRKFKTEKYLIDEIEKNLQSAVERQSYSDVPLGCFLSGGIDSSLLTAFLAKQSNSAIKTFSIGYAEKKYDETEFAEIVAKQFQTDHQTILVKPADLFALIPDLPKFTDQPLADPTILSSLILAREAKKRVTVAFSGDGGDELFFGYDHQATLHGLHYLPAALRPIAGMVLQNTLAKKNHQYFKLSEILGATSEEELIQYFIGTVGPLKLEKLKTLIDYPVLTKPSWLEKNSIIPKNTKWIDKIQYAFLKTFLIDTCLAKADRTSMAYSLEARVPFLDNEVVDLALSIPAEVKYKNFTKKYLLRRLAARHLPRSIYDRKKQGFSIPLANWLRTDLKYLLDELLSEENLKEDGLLVFAEIERLKKGHLSGKENHSHLLWSLITYQLWRKEYLQ